MDKLEKIIINNRISFDTLEPDDEHLERLEAKLNNFNKNNNYSFAYFLKAASVTILITLSSLFIYNNLTSGNKKTLSNISPEYQDVETYYIAQINNRIDKINQINYHGNKKQKELFKKEFTESDSLYINLQKELKTNPNDERVINAIIHHYQMKIDVLNSILNHFNNVKQIKTNKNENTQV
ncbi:MAG: hypothetical protein KAG95_06105 [Bacteroidales bacterium]|nr:hypothetical protein [Bacteroidales bacterium]